MYKYTVRRITRAKSFKFVASSLRTDNINKGRFDLRIYVFEVGYELSVEGTLIKPLEFEIKYILFAMIAY